MDLLTFSKGILNKDIPINTMKVIIYMLAADKISVDLNEICSSMFITKRLLINELKKTRDIENFLNIKEKQNNFTLTILNTELKLLNNAQKAKTDVAIIDSVDIVVQSLFDLWSKTMGKSQSTRLDFRRISDIKKGLKRNTEEDCALAIIGCGRNKWNMGIDTENGKKYNSLELIFRNQDKTDSFIEDSNLPDLEKQIKMTPPKKKTIEERLSDNSWVSARLDQVSAPCEPCLSENILMPCPDVRGLLHFSSSFFEKE